jgi:hypothetical protein
MIEEPKMVEFYASFLIALLLAGGIWFVVAEFVSAMLGIGIAVIIFVVVWIYTFGIAIGEW